MNILDYDGILMEIPYSVQERISELAIKEFDDIKLLYSVLPEQLKLYATVSENRAGETVLRVSIHISYGYLCSGDLFFNVKGLYFTQSVESLWVDEVDYYGPEIVHTRVWCDNIEEISLYQG